MNQQPLELYDNDCLGGYSLKLLNRAYSGAIIKVLRTGDQEAEALVYPDQYGKVSLDSPIEILSGSSQSEFLGGFLCQNLYANDPVFEEANPLVTALVTVFYDQSSNTNNLTAQVATAPILCLNGSVYNTDWGLAVNMDDNRKLSSNAMVQSFTAHYRAQFDSSSTTKYFFRQDDNALYAKVTGLYVDEAIGSGSTLVLVNEDYYSDYTTQNITMPEDQGQLVTLEVDVTNGVLSDPPSFSIENLGLFHTALFYENTGIHVRRHKTNQILSEDIPSLQEKLKKFSPQSFYNLFQGAKAIFGMFSFAGLLAENPVRLINVEVTDADGGVVNADVYANNSGYIDFNSPVSNVIRRYNSQQITNVTTFGELVGNPSYSDPANLGHHDAFLYKLYSQSVQYDNIYATPNSVLNMPKVYDSATSSLEVAGDDGICGLNCVTRTGQTDSFLNINTPFTAKSVVLVYQNESAGSDISGLTGGTPTQGVSVFAKNDFPAFNNESFQDGVGVFSTNVSIDGSIVPYVGSLFGKDTNVNVVGLYLGSDPKRLVFNENEVDINKIDDTPTQASPNGMKFKQLGGAEGYNLDGKLLAAIYYEDDRYAQEQEIQDYMNILFRAQNIPISDPKTNPYIADYSSGVANNSPASTNPFQFNVNLVPSSAYTYGVRVDADDLLLVTILYDARTYGDSSPGATPAGWTKLLDISTTPDTDLGGSVYYKVADGTETDSSGSVQFEIANTQGDISECIWYCHRVKNAATSGTIVQSSTPQAATDSDSVTAAAIAKSGSSTPIALSFAAADTGFATGWSVSGTGWGGAIKTASAGGFPSADEIATAWAYKDIDAADTTTENASWIGNTFSYTNGDRVALQLMVNDTAGSAGSPPPVGLDKTWSFDSSIESWVNNYASSDQWIASHTPSNDVQKTGIYEITSTSNSFDTSFFFDLSTLPDYESGSTIYYEITYSVPTAGNFTGLDKIIYGASGSFDSYFSSHSQIYDTWITISGDLDHTTGATLLIIEMIGFGVGSKAYFDSIRVSHTDFR